MHSLIQQELVKPVPTKASAFGMEPRRARFSVVGALRARRRRSGRGRSLRPAPAP
jgi:hypothetical protein